MPTANQINYLNAHRELIQEPILIVGSKEYDFDRENFLAHLHDWGFKDITGIDLEAGPGVDHVMDITNADSEFLSQQSGKYKTVICMQMMYAVSNPFLAAQHIERLLASSGRLFFSDIFTHKINRIPKDYWRFTYDAHKVLFSTLTFDDHKAQLGITRINKLVPLTYPFPEVSKHQMSPDENSFGFLLRRMARKWFSTGIFQVSRLLPEVSIFSCAQKK